jgi:hypothetical protein
MSYIDASIYFIIAILSISYPIMLQVIARLDDRYESRIISGLFEAEREWRWFRICLLVSLLGVATFTAGQFPPWHPIFAGNFLSNFGKVLTYSATIALIMSFFLFVKRLRQYLVPAKLIRYLQTQQDTDDNLYFKGLADILYLAIKSKDTTISEELSQHFSGLYFNFREQHPGKPYPADYYEMNYRVVRDTINIKEPKLEGVAFRSTSGMWSFDINGYTDIHQLTYSWLWRNLVTLIDNGRDDLVMNYWRHAHQFMGTGLKVIHPRINTTTFETKNQPEIDKRDRERQQFLDFHLALGGLLLYRNRYSCINRIFSYTMNTPPHYELFPINISEIIRNYMRFRDPFGTNFPFIHHQYWFPDMEGLAADGMIKEWVCRYIALLLLRQYSLPHVFVPLDPLGRPAVPANQGERRMYRDNLPYFRNLVQEALKNDDLMKVTDLDFINENWCRQNQKPVPVDLVQDYETRIQQSFTLAEIDQPLAPAKVQSFITASNRIVSGRIRTYDVIRNESSIDENYEEFSITGASMIMDKSAFAEGQGITHLNFDTFLAHTVADKITAEMSISIQSRASKRYLLKENQLLSGITRLQLDPAEHVILNFGVDIGFLQTNAGEAVEKNSIHSIPVITVEYFTPKYAPSGFMVLRKVDLPQILFTDIPQEEKDKYQLQRLNEEFLTYGSVINLHDHPTLRGLLIRSYPEEQLQKSALLCLAFHMSIRWRINVPVITLSRYNKFQQQGLTNDEKDVQPFG